jgi:uncharacterized membrane protein YphA (DoxX/SURF4 family)
MKSLLSNPHLVLLVRVFVGLLFVVSSMEKIVDPAAFSQSIANYRLLPGSSTMILATILPWLELLCGLAVLFGVFERGGSLMLSVLLIIFTAAVISALVRGLDISCGCFTQDPQSGRIGWMKVLENSTLVCLTLFLLFAETNAFSITQYIRSSDSSRDHPK